MSDTAGDFDALAVTDQTATRGSDLPRRVYDAPRNGDRSPPSQRPRCERPSRRKLASRWSWHHRLLSTSSATADEAPRFESGDQTEAQRLLVIPVDTCRCRRGSRGRSLRSFRRATGAFVPTDSRCGSARRGGTPKRMTDPRCGSLRGRRARANARTSFLTLSTRAHG